MLKRCIVLSVVMLVCGGLANKASAHERWYEFDGTHFALSIERFMGVDYTDFEGPSDGQVDARIFLNASERVVTSSARFGFDVFIRRLSIGAAGGFTSRDVGIIAPRVGYMIGLTPQLGLWLRGGAFYAAVGNVNYFGPYGEVLFNWFPISQFALHVGPTIDVAFANGNNPNYVSIGIVQFGMTAFL